MRKLFFITGIVALLTTQIFADEGTTVWSRIWGSSDTDIGFGVCVDRDKNVYVAGWTFGTFDGQANNGSRDLCLTKYNSNGTKQWTRIWGSSDTDLGYGVSVDSVGNIYVAGHTSGSFDGQSNNGGWDLCLTKYNSSGTKQWTRIWGSSSPDFGRSVSVDSADNIYVAGYTEGSFDGQSHIGGYDLCLTKYNRSGTKQWTRIWGSSASEVGSGVSVDSADNIYVAGDTSGSFDGQSNNGVRDLCLTKYSGSGSSLWSRIWGSNTEDRGKGVSVDSAGNVYVTGYTIGSFDGQSNNGDEDLCLTKYSISGTKQWTRIWGSSAREGGNGVSVDNAGNAYVVGTTYGSFDGQSNPSGAGIASLCLTKYNGSGTKQWTRIWGANASNNGNGVTIDSNGYVYVGGSASGSFDGQTNPGGGSLCLTKKVGNFYLNITNENKTISFGVDNIRLSGKQSAIVRKMCVSNSANNEVQLFDSERYWITPSIILETGTNIIFVSGTNEVSDFTSDSIIIVRGFTNEVYLDYPVSGWRTNALTLDFNVWFGSDILPDQRFLSTNSGASWFYYTNSLTFPNEGTYFWTAKGLDSSYNSHYAAQTNKLIITTTLPKISLLSPADNIILTNNFAVDLMANFGSSSFERQLSTNSGVSWFDYEPGVPVYFPGVGVWNWTVRGRNAAGWTTASETWTLEIKSEFPGDYAVFLQKPHDGAIYTDTNIEFSVASFGSFNFHGLSTNNSAFENVDFPVTKVMPEGSHFWTARGTYLIPSTTYVYAPTTNHFEIYTEESEATVRLVAPKNEAKRDYHFVNFDIFLHKTESAEISTNNGATFFEFDPPVYFSEIGEYFWTARAKDILNNWVYANKTNSIILTENVPPVANHIIINSGANYVSNRNVNLSLSASDDYLTEMRISNFSDFSGSFWQEYSTSTNWTLTSGDGNKTVYAQFRDLSGNLSEIISTNTIFDETKPIVDFVAFSSNPTKAGTLTAAVNFVDFPAGMETTVLPTVYFVTANNRTGNFSDIDFVGNVFRCESTVLNGDDGIASLDLLDGKDKAGNKMLPALNFTNFLIDTTAPTNYSIEINGGAVLAASHNVNLSINAEDVLSIEMMIANDAGFSGGSWESYSATKSWTLSGGDGERTVFIKFRDVLGNESGTETDSITVDATAPTSLSLGINSGANFVDNQNVNLTLSASDAHLSEMRISNSSDFSGSFWQEYSTSTNWTLTAGDGTKTVYAQFRDLVGNTSDVVSASIILDETKPVVDFVAFSSTPIKAGAITTTVTFADSPAGMDTTVLPTVYFVSENGRTGNFSEIDFVGNVFRGKSTVLSGDDGLAYLNIFDGSDKAGNTMLAAINITNFLIDTTAPTNCSVEINSGAVFVASHNVTLTINAEDVLPDIEMMIANDAGFSGGSWESYSATKAWTLAGGDGERTVFIKFRDALVNESGAISDNITVDATPPSNPSITINNGMNYTNSANVNLSLSASDANLREMRISNNEFFAGSFWQSFSANTNWMLEGVDGTKTVYVQFRDIVGNKSDSASANIIVDRAKPLINNVTFSANPASAGILTVNVSFADAPAGMKTTISPTVNCVTYGSRTINFSELEFSGNNWTGHGMILDGDAGIASINISDGEDLAGNVMLPAMNFTNIYIDTTAPTNCSVEINSGGIFSDSSEVNLTINAEDVLPNIEMMIANDAGFSSGSWESYSATKAWTLAGDDGSRIVYVKFRDLAENESLSKNDSIIVDTTKPLNPSVIINNGEGFITNLSVTLHLSATDVNLTEMRIANNEFFAGSFWQPFVAVTNWDFTGNEEIKTVYAQFRDIVSNESSTASANVNYDLTAPILQSATAVIDPAKSGIVTVLVSFVESGIGMDTSVSPIVFFKTTNGIDRPVSELSYSGNEWIGNGFILDGDDGVATINVSGGKDLAGYEMAASPNAGTFVIDTIPPTNYLMLINNDETFVSNLTVAVTNNTIGAVFVDLSSVQDFATFETTNYFPVFEWQLANAEGTNTIFARYKDLAGNYCETNDSIILDRVAPASPSVIINNGDLDTTNNVVRLSLSVDELYLREMKIANNASFVGVEWTSFVAEVDWTILELDGEEQTVYVKFKDAVGWESEVGEDSIMLVPEPGILWIVGFWILDYWIIGQKKIIVLS